MKQSHTNLNLKREYMETISGSLAFAMRGYQKIIYLIVWFSMSIISLHAQTPNIIYILADDLGIGDVTCYNQDSKIKTPNIDKLSSTGVLFTNAQTNSSVCTPTRYGIITGRYSWRTRLKEGVLHGYDKELIEPERKTIASFLKNYSYNTACIGKWHLGWSWNNIENGNHHVDFSKPVRNGPNSCGFDYSYNIIASLDMPPFVYVENGNCIGIPIDTIEARQGLTVHRRGVIAPGFNHATTLQNFTKKALDYIQLQSETEDPFFLYFPLTAPHAPFHPSSEFKGKSGLNLYADFVLMVDDVVKKIVEQLKVNNIYKNTIVVFTSDNGCTPLANFNELLSKGHNPSWKYRGAKSDIFDGGHRVPFIISWPERINVSSVSDQLISTTDFFRTIYDLMNELSTEDLNDEDMATPIPDNVAEDSYSFLREIPGFESLLPVRKYIVNHSFYGNFAISNGKWKLIMCPHSGGWSKPVRNSKEVANLPPKQLYNIISDVAEKNNLYYKHPEIVEILKNQLIQYVKKGRSTPGIPQKNDGPEYWEQLDWIKTE